MATQLNHESRIDSRWQRHALGTALACTLFVGALQAHGAQVHAATASVERLPLNIAAQPLRQALLLFSQQSGQNVLLDGNLDSALRSTAVEGRYSTEEALARLLQGSGYTFARTDATTVYLVPVQTRQANSEILLAPTQIQYQANDYISPSRSYRANPVSSTTRLGLSDKETPQAITVTVTSYLAYAEP